jgi:hydrogenase maturation factor
MKPEIFFLKYAFPCSFVLVLRKEIAKKEHKLLYESTKEEKLYLSKDRIEKIFWRPMKFLGSISDMRMIQKYWRFDHNIYLKKNKIKDFEDVLIEHCLAMPCEVVSVKKNEAVVKSPFLKNEVSLKTDFVNVKPGNKVTKHYDYICEKISERMYQEMVESLKKL